MSTFELVVTPYSARNDGLPSSLNNTPAWSAYLTDFYARPDVVELSTEIDPSAHGMPSNNTSGNRKLAIKWLLNQDLKNNWNAELRIVNRRPPFDKLLPKHELSFHSEEDYLAFKLAWL